MGKKSVKSNKEICTLIKQLTNPKQKISWKEQLLKERELDKLVQKKLPEVKEDSDYNIQDALYTEENPYYNRVRKLCN